MKIILVIIQNNYFNVRQNDKDIKNNYNQNNKMIILI